MKDISEYDISENNNPLGRVVINDGVFIRMVNDKHKEEKEREEQEKLSEQREKIEAIKARKALQRKQRILGGTLAAVALVGSYFFAKHIIETTPDPYSTAVSSVDEVRDYLKNDNNESAYIKAEQLLSNPYLSDEDRRFIEEFINNSRQTVADRSISNGF